MAAAIKMDELLVTWLSSDNVYENVEQLIERYRSSTNNTNAIGTPSKSGSSSVTSPPNSPNRRSHGGDDSSSSLKGDDDAKSTSDASPRGVATIPPFYRRVGSVSKAGGIAPPIRRKNLFDADQSWEGIFTEKNDNANNNQPMTDGNSDNKNDPAAPARPIKEQVLAIFKELGKKTEDSGDDDDDDDNLFLTMDNFVKITKDICSFPTFFNGPLYKRILYLWNTHTLKNHSQKLIIWNEFQKEELRCIGIDPSEEKEEDKNELLEHLDRVITMEIFKWYWVEEMENYDASERFFRLLKKPFENYVGKDEFSPYMKELLRDHPVCMNMNNQL